MTRDEETRYLRKLQEADRETLLAHLTLAKVEPHPMKRRRADASDGELMEEIQPLRLSFDAVEGEDEGYLVIDVLPGEKSPVGAQMDVGFPTMIGLNRSPLELRILAEHVLEVLDDDIQAAIDALPKDA